MKKKYTKYAVLAALLVFITFLLSMAVVNNSGKPVSTYSGIVKVTTANGQIAGNDLYELPSTIIKDSGVYHLFADMECEDYMVDTEVDSLVNGNDSVLAFEEGRYLYKLSSLKASLNKDDEVTMCLRFKPSEDEPIKDGDHYVEYTVQVMRDNTLSTFTAAFSFGSVLVGVISFVLFFISDKKKSKGFDEMQLMYRGQAALSALLTCLVILLGFMFCFFMEVIPFDAATLVTVIFYPSLGVFIIHADSHDAYTVFKENTTNRKIIGPLFLAVGIITTAMFLPQLFLVIRNQEKMLELPRYIASNSFFLMVGIEMIIKTHSDKKEAELEARMETENEES